MKYKILVTGANGQLGKSLKNLMSGIDIFDIRFTDLDELDICNQSEILAYFEEFKPHFCVNCAAYTAVDNAEKDINKAYLINADAVAFLAKQCAKMDTTFLHISTEYVYHNNGQDFNREDSPTQPKTIYGKSKLKGEKAIAKIMSKYFIIRTSWLYSEYGNNFVKTMLRLANEHKTLKIVDDQNGSPTYAGDLAAYILSIIKKEVANQESAYGVYNFSNTAFCSWYDFAQEIFKIKKKDLEIKAISSKEYPTPAKRPLNSKMSKKKAMENFNIYIPHWKESLALCLENLE